MSERVSLAAAGQRLGVSGGDIRQAGCAEVTAARLEAWEHKPPPWLRKARARKRRPRRAEVLCWVCGTVREARPSLVGKYTHLVRGPCSRSGKQPEVPSRPGMILVRAFNVAGYFHGVRPPDRQSRGAHQRLPGCWFGSRCLPELCGRAGVLMARFEIPDGWTVQAFQFAADCTPEQAARVRRQFGGRRYARNWAVRTLKEDLTRYGETGEETDAPSLAGLRKR
jgi:hypothetical protein